MIRIQHPVVTAFAYASRRSYGYPREAKLACGLSIQVCDWDELTTVWHVWCADEYKVPKQCTRVLDLGANIGAFALWAADQCPDATIYSVEPFPTTYQRLRETIGRNALENRVICERFAIGGIDGDVAFDASVGKRSYCRQIVADSEAADKVMVPCLTLETALNRLGLSDVDCIKMDIEGGEHALFAATSDETLRRAKRFTMEYHDAVKSRLIWKRFERAGFQRVAFTDNGWSGLATYLRRD